MAIIIRVSLWFLGEQFAHDIVRLLFLSFLIDSDRLVLVSAHLDLRAVRTDNILSIRHQGLRLVNHRLFFLLLCASSRAPLNLGLFLLKNQVHDRLLLRRDCLEPRTLNHINRPPCLIHFFYYN